MSKVGKNDVTEAYNLGVFLSDKLATMRKNSRFGNVVCPVMTLWCHLTVLIRLEVGPLTVLSLNQHHRQPEAHV